MTEPRAECGVRKPTFYGCDACCCLLSGHEGNHESADFWWTDALGVAVPKAFDGGEL